MLFMLLRLAGRVPALSARAWHARTGICRRLARVQPGRKLPDARSWCSATTIWPWPCARSIAEAFDFDAVQIDRGALLSEADLDALEEPYLRFEITESGVSPRAVPGHPKAVYMATSNEHDERGVITEEIGDAHGAGGQAGAQELIGHGRDGRSHVVRPGERRDHLVCLGDDHRPAARGGGSAERTAAGGRANVLHFNELWPFPTEAVNEALDRGQAGSLPSRSTPRRNWRP